MKVSELLDYCDALAKQHEGGRVELEFPLFEQLIALIPEDVPNAQPLMQGRTLGVLASWARLAVQDAVTEKLTNGSG